MKVCFSVLKRLLQEKLSEMIADEAKKEKQPYIHNAQLSAAQKQKLNVALDRLLNYKPKGEEKKDDLKKIIEDCRDEVTEVRRQFKYSVTKSDTLKALGNLMLRIDDFYKRLEKLDSKLLALETGSRPIHILIYHALHYLGVEIIFPEDGDPSVRESKETQLVSRINDAIRLDDEDLALEKQGEKVCKLILDIARDNGEICGEGTSTIGLPVFSAFGIEIKIPVTGFGPSLGRLGRNLDQVVSEIKELVEKSAAPRPEMA